MKYVVNGMGLIAFVLLVSSCGHKSYDFAQQSAPPNQPAAPGASSVNPATPQAEQGVRGSYYHYKEEGFIYKLFHKEPQSLAAEYDQLVDEYYERMKQNAKNDRKMEKEMKKPQYSDPLYFGHKHPPKKRPPGKRKYCKVCGMVH